MSGSNTPEPSEIEIADEEFRQIYESVKAKPHDELALEYARLLYVLENVATDLKDWILGIGKKIRVYKRDWTPIEGYLVGFEADITVLKLDVTELIQQYDKPVNKVERRIANIPAGSISMFEWIEFEQEVPKEEKR